VFKGSAVIARRVCHPASCGTRCTRSITIYVASALGSSIMPNDTVLACASKRRWLKARPTFWSTGGWTSRSRCDGRDEALLQVRCAAHNGALGSGFGNLFEPVSTSTPPL